MVKNLPVNAEDTGHSGLFPELGRSPWKENGKPLQYFCLNNPMDRGAIGSQLDITDHALKNYKQNVQQVLIIEYFPVFHHFYSFHPKFFLEHLSSAFFTLSNHSGRCEIISCMCLCFLNFRMNSMFLEGKRLWRKIMKEIQSAFVFMARGEPRKESEISVIGDE